MDEKSGILKILSIFESGLFIKILSVFIVGLWIISIILSNLYIVIMAVILSCALGTVLYIHRSNLKEILKGNSNILVEDERTQFINEKAATMTLGISQMMILWVGIIIINFKNEYPSSLPISCTLFIITAFCIVLYLFARIYYNRKF
ncbi:MAG: DUF2178 domain-containing protein [Methanobacterium sp.]|nr:DUF2178 domain-containing protein [Methanobacterium sp.]